jgi:hypothetical protein
MAGRIVVSRSGPVEAECTIGFVTGVLESSAICRTGLARDQTESVIIDVVDNGAGTVHNVADAIQMVGEQPGRAGESSRANHWLAPSPLT